MNQGSHPFRLLSTRILGVLSAKWEIVLQPVFKFGGDPTGTYLSGHPTYAKRLNRGSANYISGGVEPQGESLICAVTKPTKQCFDTHPRHVHRAPVLIGLWIERSKACGFDSRVRGKGLYRIYQPGDREAAGRTPLVRNGLGWVKDIKIKMNIETSRLRGDFLDRKQRAVIN